MLFVDERFDLPLTPLTLLCSALVVLISFRNSSAYARWWEARTLWGRHGQQLAQLRPPGADPDRRPGQGAESGQGRAAASAHGLPACPARPAQAPGPAQAAAPYLARHELALADGSLNFANDILAGTAELIASEYRQGRLDSIRLARLEETLVDMSNWQGGMERIANTPLPYPYVCFPQLFSFLFCIAMPLGLVSTLGWFTPLVSTVVGFMLLALERIGSDLQAPFADSQHQITMDKLCATIEANLLSMLRPRSEEGSAVALAQPEVDAVPSRRVA